MPDPTVENYTLKKVPIFSTGTWHGDPYSEADLDAMVDAFDKVGFTPPGKLGHPEKQKMLQQAGLPAAGWVEKIYRQGTTLFADFKNIPKKIYQLFQNKAYGPVSSEVYWNYTDKDGKKWPRVLRAVAFLGADIPEVTTIDGVLSMFDEANREYKVVIFGSQAKNKESKMTEEEIKKFQKEAEEKAEAKVAEMSKQFEAKMAEQAKQFTSAIDAMKAENAQKDEVIQSERKARRKQEIETKIKEYVTARKITPAQAPFMVALMSALSHDGEHVVIFSKDGTPEEKKFTGADLIQKFVDAQPEIFSDKEQTKQGIDANDLEAKIKNFCKENSLDYNTSEGYNKALLAVTKEV